jgi:hypothetical protein
MRTINSSIGLEVPVWSDIPGPRRNDRFRQGKWIGATGQCRQIGDAGYAIVETKEEAKLWKCLGFNNLYNPWQSSTNWVERRGM